MIRFALFMLTIMSVTAQAADLDGEIANYRKDVLEINKSLLLMEEELLFPADTQVAIFVSLDVGKFFVPDSVTLKLDGKTVDSHLYTEKEVRALMNGAIQKMHTANVKTGAHELTAFVTGQGPNGREYRRAVTFELEKGHGRQFVQLKIEDDVAAQQPTFSFRSWQ